MITIKGSFTNITNDEFNQLLDAPVWLTLLAAFRNDGRLTGAERKEAIRLTHLRSFTAPKSLRGLYRKIEQNFPQRLKKLHDRLPEDVENKICYIHGQVKAVHRILKKLDPDVAESLQVSLSSFYKHIFNCDKGFFHYFALPVISGHVEKKYSGELHLSDV